MNNAFPPEFLHPLLRISLLDDPGLRVVVQEILHTLLDRHDNASKLKTVRYNLFHRLHLFSVNQDLVFAREVCLLFLT